MREEEKNEEKYRIEGGKKSRRSPQLRGKKTFLFLLKSNADYNCISILDVKFIKASSCKKNSRSF